MERGRSCIDAENGTRLSPTTTRPRPKSVTPSVRSSRSDVTFVGERSDNDISFRNRRLKRARTQVQVVEPKVSRWILFFGVFLGTEWASRKIKFDIRNTYDSEDEDESDDDETDEKNDDYIQTVKVVTTGAEVEGRCLFDTGCGQGNIVSVEFAERLGFTLDDFKRLRGEERFGATSATGERIEPLGALKLTWYHKRSVKMFHGMRFLVTPHTNYDMVIGSASLKKHDLVAPPNFEFTVDAKPAPNLVTVKNLFNDKEGEGLRKAEEDFHNRLLTLQKKKPAPTAAQKTKDKYKAVEEKVTAQYNVARNRRKLYEKEQDQKLDPKNESLISRVKRLREKLEESKRTLEEAKGGKTEVGNQGNGNKKEDNDGKESENALSPQSSPEIEFTVSEPGGKTRAPTGLDVVPPKSGIRNRK